MFGGQVNPSGAHRRRAARGRASRSTGGSTPTSIAQAPNTNSIIKAILAERSSPSTADGKTITGFESGFNQTNLTLAGDDPERRGARCRSSSSATTSTTGSRRHSRRRTACEGGVRLGNPKDAGDWAASLLYEYLERDASIGAFSWSDFGNGGTNLSRARSSQLDYQLFKPLTLTARSVLHEVHRRAAERHQQPDAGAAPAGRDAPVLVRADAMRVGVVGLGIMGAPMARNLLRAGHAVTVHSRTPARVGAAGRRRAPAAAASPRGRGARSTPSSRACPTRPTSRRWSPVPTASSPAPRPGCS